MSLGAPFWFDALSKALRMTGKVPARSSEAPSPAAAPGVDKPGPAMPPVAGAVIIDGPEDFESRCLSVYDIVDIQKALKVEPASGGLDEATRIAIKAKQAKLGLPQNGVLTAELAVKILNGSPSE